jgi:hypothetical protein
VVVAGGWTWLSVSPAAAELNGPCQAVGTIEETGLVIDPSTGDGPFVVPLEGTVAWSGQVGDGEDTEARSTNGGVAVVGPPIVDAVLGGLLEFRDWGEDDAVSTLESGTDTYTLPEYTPRDTELLVTGFHDDSAGNCDGEVIIVVEGEPLDSPFAVASLAGTVITGAGLAVAAMSKVVR